MKELSIKEKAEAYDYAVNKAKELILNENGFIRVDKPLFNELFPSESEDERIRKGLIGYFSDFRLGTFAGIDPKKIITWLEKQENKKDNLSIDFVLDYLGIKPAYKDGNAWCILLGDNIQEGICGFGDTKEEALITFIKELIENQGEKKPFDYENANIQQNDFAVKPATESITEETVDNANKVEPKFKVGDWITFYGGKPFKILDIKREENGSLDYLLLNQDGHNSYYNKKYIDTNAKLWTIKDAKDGDVLVEETGNIVMFNHLGYNEDDGGNDRTTYYFTYCWVGLDGEFSTDGNFDIYKTRPATKEQRDLLFQKMKEAGYVWDSDAKRLKKIEELTAPENESHIILLDKTMNWDEIRVQAAIAAMQGMLANATLVDDTRLEYRITVEKAAVDYANILVEELKKKGKEL